MYIIRRLDFLFIIFLIIIFIFVFASFHIYQDDVTSSFDVFDNFIEQKKELSCLSEEASLVIDFKNLFNKEDSNLYRIDVLENSSWGKYSYENYDLDHDLIKEDYFLQDGVLVLRENSEILWQSPDDWWIDSFFLADSNNDGLIDINISLWKVGSFGTSKPFWIEEDDMLIRNHFFVFDFINDRVELIWGSSNLSSPNCQFTIFDIDDDGENELITIEGDYLDYPDCHSKYLSVWKWNGWGFSNFWRSNQINEEYG